MQFLTHYEQLPTNNQNDLVNKEKAFQTNQLQLTYFQSRKIQRLLSGRLGNENITFVEKQDRQYIQFLAKDNPDQDQKVKRGKMDVQNQLNFCLIIKSKHNQYEISINFCINLKRALLTFSSHLMKNYRIMRIDSRSLVRFMGKYFISYNGKLREGSFYVKPITKEIIFILNSQWTLQSISSLIRNPQKFLNYVIAQIQQIASKWNQCIDTILYLINQKKYFQITPNKKLKYVKMKLKRVSQMVIHSHLDASFFVQNKPINIPRFKSIDEEQRNQRLFQINKDLSLMEKNCRPLSVISQILQIFQSKTRINDVRYEFPKWQLADKKQLAINLACQQYGGKFKIYSEIQILKLQSSACIFESIFSRIFRIQGIFRRQQNQNPNRGFLIRKKTQPKRYQNQISILKLLKNQKCLFIPRYYFCQHQEYKQDIFIEFIPESSIDKYIISKDTFLGSQTKLFLLFQLIIALRFLRDNQIVHIDLKPQNVLVKIVGDAKQNVHYLIKLIDFGQSYSPKLDKISSNVNRGFTIPYAPPQLLGKGYHFDQKTDVYSFGVIMLKLIFNHFPPEIIKLKKRDFIHQNYIKFYSFPFQKMESFGTKEFMQIMYYLCLKCIQPDPHDRPTLDWLCIILKELIITYEELSK